MVLGTFLTSIIYFSYGHNLLNMDCLTILRVKFYQIHTHTEVYIEKETKAFPLFSIQEN